MFLFTETLDRKNSTNLTSSRWHTDFNDLTMGQILPQPTGASQKPYETSVTGRGNEPGSALRFLSAL